MVSQDVQCVGGELRFAWGYPNLNVRKPSSTLLERFLGLRTDKGILQFARRCGPLGLFPVADGFEAMPARLRPHLHRGVHREPVKAWRFFQEGLQDLLALAATSREAGTMGTMGDLAYLPKGHDWRRWPARAQRTFADLLFRESLEQLVRQCGLRLTLSTIGAPEFVFQDDIAEEGWGLSLFGALTAQAMTAVAGSSLAMCSGCGGVFVPNGRQPASGRRRYCQECRERGVPQRDAKADYRAKRRRRKVLRSRYASP